LRCRLCDNSYGITRIDNFVKNAILNLYYEQKTQRASLLVDKLLSLEDKQLQAVYMTMIINEVEENIKDQLKDYIDNM